MFILVRRDRLESSTGQPTLTFLFFRWVMQGVGCLILVLSETAIPVSFTSSPPPKADGRASPMSQSPKTVPGPNFLQCTVSRSFVLVPCPSLLFHSFVPLFYITLLFQFPCRISCFNRPFQDPAPNFGLNAIGVCLRAVQSGLASRRSLIL